MTEEGKKEIKTSSGIPLKPAYGPEDITDLDYKNHIGNAGAPPYVRGIYPEMYRTKPWYIRQISGFNTTEETNERFKYLYATGQRAFCPAYDHPARWGLNPLDSRVINEVGVCGFTLDVVDDFHRIFDGIPLDAINITIDAPSPSHPVALCMFLIAAEEAGLDIGKLHGNNSNCLLLSHLLAPTQDALPPHSILKLAVDTVEWQIHNTPHWHHTLINGYVMRESGINAYQEIALNFATAMTIIDGVLARDSADIDQIMPGVTFNFGSHRDFFEEIAKFRAARKMWYQLIKERYKAKDPRSCQLRFHVQTSGSTYTAREPFNNIIRATYQALAAALGGVQSMMVCSFDEAIALPFAGSAALSIRTQQILQHESGITNVADPLGGSYYVEWLTNKVEEKAWEYLGEIDKQGGYLAGIASGWIAAEFKKAQYDYQRRQDSGELKLIGVNYNPVDQEPIELPSLYEQRLNLDIVEYERRKRDKIMQERDNNNVEIALRDLREATIEGKNVFPALIKAVRARAMMDECCHIFRDVWGAYQPPIWG